MASVRSRAWSTPRWALCSAPPGQRGRAVRLSQCGGSWALPCAGVQMPPVRALGPFLAVPLSGESPGAAPLSRARCVAWRARRRWLGQQDWPVAGGLGALGRHRASENRGERGVGKGAAGAVLWGSTGAGAAGPSPSAPSSVPFPAPVCCWGCLVGEQLKVAEGGTGNSLPSCCRAQRSMGCVRVMGDALAA